MRGAANRVNLTIHLHFPVRPIRGLFGAVICDTGHDGSRTGRDGYGLLRHNERVATEAYDHIAGSTNSPGGCLTFPTAVQAVTSAALRTIFTSAAPGASTGVTQPIGSDGKQVTCLASISTRTPQILLLPRSSPWRVSVTGHQKTAESPHQPELWLVGAVAKALRSQNDLDLGRRIRVRVNQVDRAAASIRNPDSRGPDPRLRRRLRKRRSDVDAGLQL